MTGVQAIAVGVTRTAGVGFIVGCSCCGRVARREADVDAQAKAQRHAEQHQRDGHHAQVTP